LLNHAPAFSQWVITYSYSQERPQPGKDAPARPLDSALPRKVTTTKTREIIHEQTVSVSGATFEKWQVGRIFYIKPQGQKHWGACDERFVKSNLIPNASLSFLPANGFRDLDWINSETYAGAVKQNNTTYLLFVPKSAGNLDYGKPAKIQAQPVIAYVDDATRLPALFKNADVTQTYAFSPPPTAMQALPPDLAKQIKEVSEMHAKVFGAPRAEY